MTWRSFNLRGSLRARRPFGLAPYLIAAILGHGAALALLRLAPDSPLLPRTAGATAAPLETLLDADIFTDNQPLVAPTADSDPMAPPRLPEEKTSAQRRSTASSSVAPVALPPAISPAPAGTDSSRNAAETGTNAAASGSAIVPDPRRFALRAREAAASMDSPPTPTGAEPRTPNDGVRAERVFQDLRDRHDLSLGLGVGGPVVTAAREAALSAEAPQEGAATFEVVVDETGTAIRADVDPGNAPGWSRCANLLLARLRQRKIRVPTGAKGMRIRVHVEANVALPSGRKQGAGVRLFGLNPAHGALRLNDLQRGSLTPIAIEGDPADIGAKATRSVHVRVVEEQRLR